MAHTTMNTEDVQARLWSEVGKHHTGMLGVFGDSHHFQPMTAFVEPEASLIWFFTYKDTDLAKAVALAGEAGGRAPAAFIFQSREVQACIDGALSLAHDPERIERYWNAHVAAWYPEGKDDPRLTLLRLDCAEAGVWLSEAGPIRYAIEVARANAGHHTPDIGERRDVNFH